MPTLPIADHTIYYETHGKGHPLVLISGLGASHLFWWKQIAPLSAHFRLIALDNRGIGDSSRVQAAFSMADMADDVAALIDHLKLGPCFVLGISMGGFVAATFGVRHARLVEKLILTSTSAGGPTHQAASKEILTMLINTDGTSVEAYTRQIYTTIAGSNYMQTHPEDLDRIVANATAAPLSPETYLYQLNAINGYVTTQGVTEVLDRIVAPTMVIHGDVDPLVPYVNGQHLAQKIKGATLRTYAGVGHLPPIEATDRFNRDVRDFLGAPIP
jgi:pimeloyl-ACP methyl ester carboxylesterase